MGHNHMHHTVQIQFTKIRGTEQGQSSTNVRRYLNLENY